MFRKLLAPNDAAGGTPPQPPSTPEAKMTAAIAAASASMEKENGPAATKLVKPVIKDPPLQALEGDFDDSDAPPELSANDVPVKFDKTKATNIKTAAETEAEQQRQAEEAAKAKAKEAQPPQQKVAEKGKPLAPDTKGDKRDYTGFSEHEVAVFRQMSTPAFEFAAKTLRELRTLQQQKPESYLQHPEAYTLSPEYVEIQQQATALKSEAKHWKEQLLAIRAGKPWYGLAYDDKGNAIKQGPYKPTEAAEIDVGNAYNVVTNHAVDTGRKVGQLKATFQERVNTSLQAITNERAKRFEWVADPTKQDVELELGDGKKVPIKTVIGQFKDMFDRHHHGNPLLDLAADMFVALQIQQQHIAQLKSNVLHKEKLNKDILNAEPPVDGGAASGAPTEKVFDISGMPD